MEEAARQTDRGARRYWAFLSYSHRDRRVAHWLHRALEGYRIPNRLVGRTTARGTVPARLHPVFRDREELPTSADLGAQIDRALEASDTLVVVCSPHAASSKWVNQEVLAFKRLGRSERLVCVIVGGEPNASAKPDLGREECFPEALRFRVGGDGELTDEQVEPIAADLRPGGESKRDALLKIVAGIVGIGFDALKQRDLHRQKRRLLAVTAGALAVAALTITLAVLALLASREADRQRGLAEAQGREVSQRLAREYVSRAWRATEQGDPSAALLWLAEALDVEPSGDGGSGIAAHRLRLSLLLQAHPELMTASAPDTPRREVVVAPDGRRAASVESDGSVRMWDLETGLTSGPALRQAAAIVSATFDPSGTRLVTSGADFVALVRDADTGKVRLPPLAHETVPEPMFYAVFSPDGQRLVTRQYRFARLWDAATGAPLTDRLGEVEDARFNATGARLVVWSASRLTVYDAATGTPLSDADVGHDVVDVHLDPNGRFAVTEGGSQARAWRLDNGAAISEVIDDVADVGFTDEGPRMLLLREGTELRVLDVASGRDRTLARPGVESVRLAPKADRLLAWTSDALGVIDADGNDPVVDSGLRGRSIPSWSPDGTRAFCLTEPASFLFDPASGALVGEPMPGVRDVRFVLDGARLMTLGDYGLSIWNAASGARLAGPVPVPDNTRITGRDPHSRLLATNHYDGIDYVDWFIRFWDVETGRRVFPPTITWPHASLSRSLVIDAGAGVVDAVLTDESVIAVSRDSSRAWRLSDGALDSTVPWPTPTIFAHLTSAGLSITVDETGVASIRDAHSGLRRGPGMQHENRFAFSQTSLRVIGPDFRRWDPESGEPTAPTWPPDFTSELLHIAVAGDGAHLATARADELRLWSVATGEATAERRGVPGPIIQLAVGPRGRRAAFSGGVVGRGTRTETWQAGDADAVRLDVTSPHLTHLAFDDAGRQLAVGGEDGALELWDLGTGTRRIGPLAHSSTITRLAFDPGGGNVAVGTFAGSVDVYAAASGRRRFPTFETAAAVSDTVFSPDGRMLGVAGTDGSAWIIDPTDGSALSPRLDVGSDVLRIRFGADSRTFLAVGTKGRISVWRLDPIGASREDVTRWAELVSLRRVSADGTPQELDEEDLYERLRRIRDR